MRGGFPGPPSTGRPSGVLRDGQAAQDGRHPQLVQLLAHVQVHAGRGAPRDPGVGQE